MEEAVWQDKSTLQRFLTRIVRALSEKELQETAPKAYNYRNVWNYDALEKTLGYIKEQFCALGYAEADITVLSFPASFGKTICRSATCEVSNLVVTVKGATHPSEIIIVGAHYDSRVTIKEQRGRIPVDSDIDKTTHHPMNTPGANDNGSGVAALLALAAAFSGKNPERTICFVAWVNEEFPFYAHTFASGAGDYYACGMGSIVHARQCAEPDENGRRKNIKAVISLDTLGCYPGTDYRYPGRSWWERILLSLLRFPRRGDYVAFLSDTPSAGLVKKFKQIYDQGAVVPSIRRHPWIVNRLLRNGAWSDDWSYWQMGYQGFIVTDTAFLRSSNYHTANDTIENMHFPQFTEVVWQLRSAIEACARSAF